MPDTLSAASEKASHNMYEILTRVLQESNANIKKLDDTIICLSKGQEKS